MTERWQRSWRALPWGVADQVVWAASNAAVVLIAASRLGPAEFGRFSVALSVAMIVVGASRTWIGQPLVIAHAAEAERGQREKAAASLAAAARLSAALAVVAFAAAGLVEPARELGVALGLCCIPLIVQDALRWVYFLGERPWAAAVCDAVWLVWVIGVALWTGSRDAASLLLLWAVGALLAALVALAHLRIGRQVWAAARRPWFRPHAQLAAGLLADTALVTLYGFAIPIVLAWLASLDDAGTFRLAQTLIGPATLVTVGAATQWLPRMVKARAAGQHVGGVAAGVALRCAAAAAGYTAALALVPHAWGVELAGSNWGATRRTAIVLGISSVAGALLMGSLLRLRSGGLSAALARTRGALFPLQLGAVIAGAVLGGALGAAVALSVGNWLSIPVWSWVVRRTDGAQSGWRSRSLRRSGRAGTPT